MRGSRCDGRVGVEPRDSRRHRAPHAAESNKIGSLTESTAQGAANATTELGRVTKALRDGATALNKTVGTGNRLSRRVWLLNWLVILLMLVQIAQACRR
jgi:hypothetical protein